MVQEIASENTVGFVAHRTGKGYTEDTTATGAKYVKYNQADAAEFGFTLTGIMSNNTLTNATADSQGREILNGTAITYNASTITIADATLLDNANNVSIQPVTANDTSFAKYNVTLDSKISDTLAQKTIDAKWGFGNDGEATEDTTTVVYYSTGLESGYTVVDATNTAGSYIEYKASVHGASEAAITGLTMTADEVAEGLTIKGSTIVMQKDFLDSHIGSTELTTITENGSTTMVFVLLESENYKFSLDSSALSKDTAASWAVTKGTGVVTYTEEAESAGYDITSDKQGIVKHSEIGGAEFTISGLSTKTALNKTKTITGIKIEDDEFLTRTIFISSNLLNNQDVTLSGTSKIPLTSYKLYTDAEEATARESDFWRSNTVSGGKGTATLISGEGSYYEGYSIETSETGVSYIKYTEEQTGTALTKLSGLKSSVVSKTKNESITGITVSDESEVTIASTLITTGTSGGVTIEGGSAAEFKYKLGGKAKMVYSNTENTTLTGSTGNDTIVNTGSGTAVATIDGGKGNDSIVAGKNGDYIVASAGNDTISIGSGSDTIVYEAGKVVVQNYQSGVTIDTSDLTVGKSTFKSNNLTVNVGSGSITFNNIRTTEVELDDKVYAGGYIYEDDRTKVSFSDGFTPTGNALTVASGVKEFDASALTGPVRITNAADGASILGTKKNDTINTGSGSASVDGGVGNDSIYSGAGDNTLIGGAGNDTFVYAGGNDIITDYGVGKDVISFADSITVADSEIDADNNIILTLSNENTLTLEGANGKLINVAGSSQYYGNHAVINSKKTAATLGAEASEFDANAYSTLVTIDGSAATGNIKLTGNAKANVITAGNGGVTLDGGKGNDTLYGGTGADTFIYTKGEGKDVIKNYGTGDAISLSGGFADVTNASINNKGDLILSIGSQSLTLSELVTGGATTADVVINNNTYTFGNGYYIDSKGTTATMFPAFKGTLDLSAKTVKTINGEGSKNAMNIVGNAERNTISGGAKADTLSGGAGNDSLNGGAGNDSLNGGAGNDTLTGGKGNDIFTYVSGEGNDTITDYASGKDKIRIEGGTITKSQNSAGKVVFTITSEDGSTTNTLTVNFDTKTSYNAKTQKITTIENGKTSTKSYPAAASRTLELLYDNNFTSEEFTLDDVAEVKDSKFAVGDVKTTDTTTLTPDETALTYGNDDENK